MEARDFLPQDVSHTVATEPVDLLSYKVGLDKLLERGGDRANWYYCTRPEKHSDFFHGDEPACIPLSLI
jgi:hypothetical protein